MSRPPQKPGQPLIRPLMIKMNDRMLEALDSLRGSTSRQDYVRQLIRNEYNEQRKKIKR